MPLRGPPYSFTMRLCLDSFVPPLDRINLGTAVWVRELGFRMIGVDLESWIDIDATGCRSIQNLLVGEGISIGQVWSVDTPLVRPDPDERARSVARLTERIPLVAALGCRVLLTEPGGYHPVNGWYPHPMNHTDEALDTLVSQVRRLSARAMDHDVVVAPEMSLLSVLSSVERVEEMLNGVGNAGVGVNYDPANITEPRWLYETGAQIREAFDRIGDRIVNAHAKDVVAREVPLVVHLDEVPAGEGVLDYATFLNCLSRIPGQTCLVIEHLSDYGEITEVKRFLETTAHQEGLIWKDDNE